MQEGQKIEKKSLRLVLGKAANWTELAKDCVCFANARGGTIHIGIEDDAELPPLEQQIEAELPYRISKRISELTINVGTIPSIETASNGGQYIALRILQSGSTIASTTDGKYFYRISDECKPVLPEDLIRLMTDKPAFIWETKSVKSVKRTDFDAEKMAVFISDIRASDRVTVFVKNKTADELLDYYLMADGDYLTNLGIFRKFIPNYEEEVIRELIANALVHRPYTTRGDVFINLFTDRLEVHNPGLLPMGIRR